MIVDIAFIVFAVCGLGVFAFCRPPLAVLIVFLGGWVLLPVGHYPPSAAPTDFPYWITGLAVPSDMLLTKAWVAPAVALAGALAFDRRTLLALRPAWFDAPIALWCLWPLVQAVFGEAPRPQAWLSSAYLAGCWGLPWLLGRAYFASADARRLLAQGLAVSALACLPFSLFEGMLGPDAYGAVYGPHPFRFDGDERYLGFRPIGLFEHGNQFGLWVSLCALAAVWLAVTARGRQRPLAIAVACALVAMSLLAQSVGGILLLAFGAGLLGVCRYLRPRRMVAAALAVLVFGGAVYVSGVVPFVQMGRDTALGRGVVDAFRAVGRGSFAWRIAQDQKSLKEATARPLVGRASWDWWRPQGRRPWGLSILVLGQFGLVGLCACLGSLLWPALRVAWHAPQSSGWLPAALPLMLASLVVLTVADALMNSFIFFPAVLIAGALAAVPELRRRARGEITRIPQRA